MAKEIIQIELYANAEDETLPQLRSLIHEAMNESGMLPSWVEYYQGYGNLPEYVKRLRPPSIIINERRVWDGNSCEGKLPAMEEMKRAIQNSKQRSGKIRYKRIIKKNASFFLALFIAFFPKCPFCWAAYLSALGLYQFSSITYQPWMLPVFIILLFLNILSLYLTRKRHDTGPLILSLTGSLVIVMNRMIFDIRDLIFLGSALLLLGALWNSVSRDMVISLRNYVAHLFRVKLNRGE